MKAYRINIRAATMQRRDRLRIVAINGWNRFGIAFHATPGHYQPIRQHESAMI